MVNYRLLLKKIKSRGLNASDVCRDILHANTRLDLCINSRHNGLSHEEIMQLKSLLGLSSIEVMRIFFMEMYVTSSDTVVCEKISLLEFALRKFNANLRLIVENISQAKRLLFSISTIIKLVVSFHKNGFIRSFSIAKNEVYPENESDTVNWYSHIRFTTKDIDDDKCIDFHSFPKLFQDVTYCNSVFSFVFNNI